MLDGSSCSFLLGCTIAAQLHMRAKLRTAAPIAAADPRFESCPREGIWPERVRRGVRHPHYLGFRASPGKSDYAHPENSRGESTPTRVPFRPNKLSVLLSSPLVRWAERRAPGAASLSPKAEGEVRGKLGST